MASVMEKVNLYNKREFTAMGHGLNESFRSYHQYNQDIYFTMPERQAIVEMLEAVREQLREEYEEEIQCYRSVMVNEGFMDVLKNVTGKTKEIADNIKDEFKNGVKDVKVWAEDKIEKAKEKYSQMIQFINNLIKAGIKSVKGLIENIGKLLTKIADKLSDALAKLGAFAKPDEGEQEADVNVDSNYLAEVPSEQQGFFKHVVAYMTTMTGTGKAERLMQESFDFECEGKTALNEGLIDTVANNKFVQFILCYGKDKKVSWWKSLLISLVGSFIISVVLPVALTAFGTGAAAISTICGAVALVWQSKGILKILLNRYINKKPGETFFDFPTTIALVLAIVPMAIMKIPAVNQFMQEQFLKLMQHFKFVIDKLGEAFSKFFDLIREKSPEFIVKHTTVVKECLAQCGVTKVLFKGSIDQSRTDAANALLNSGAPKDLVDAQNGLYDAVDGQKTSMGIIKAATSWLKNNPHPQCAMLDSSKFGDPAKMMQLMNDAVKDGVLKNTTIQNLIGKEVFDATKGMAGANTLLNNLSPEEYQAFLEYGSKNFAKYGIEKGAVFLQYFPGDAIKTKVTEVSTSIVKVATDWMANLHFTPVFVPILDSKHWGDYRISFASETAGFKAYKVSEVKMMTVKEVEKMDQDNPAVGKLIGNLKNIQQKHKELIDSAEDKVDAIKESKEIDPDKLPAIITNPKNLPDIWQEHGVVVIDNDKHEVAPLPKKELKKIEQGRDDKDNEDFLDHEKENYEKNGNLEDTEVMVIFVDVKDKETGEFEKKPGVMIDLTSLMCADIAPFCKKRRKAPYFLKGLFGKLSFSPTKANDNSMKEYIHETLAKIMETACRTCVKNGTGNFYIIQDDKGKFFPMPLMSGEQFDMGNLTPDELCKVLNCEDKVNEEAYELLSGKYTRNLTFGKKGPKARKTTGTRETARYSLDEKTLKFVKDPKGEYDYIDAKVIPEINYSGGEIYKQLVDNKDLRKLFMVKSPNSDEYHFNCEMFKDKDLDLKKYLFRPETTFSSKDKKKIIDGIKKYKKEHEDTKWYQRVSDWFDSDDAMYDAFREGIEIIWDELGSKNISDYISIRKKIEQTNESTLMTFDEFLSD